MSISEKLRRGGTIHSEDDNATMAEAADVIDALVEAGDAFLNTYRRHGTGEAPTFGLPHIREKREAFRAALARAKGDKP